MPDIFDELAAPTPSGGDIFDSIPKPAGAVESAHPGSDATLSGFGENIKSDAIEQIKAYGAMLNPTTWPSMVKGLYQLGMGSPMSSGTQPVMIPIKAALQTPEDRAVYAGMTKYMQDKYGSLENAKKTMYEKPIEVLGDLSGFLSLGSSALAQAPKATKAAQIARMASSATDPLNIARQAATAPIRAVGATRLPQRMYMGVVKPPKSMTPLERGQSFKAAYQEKILPTPQGITERAGVPRGLLGGSGYEALQPKMQGLAGEIGQALKDADLSGGKVSMERVVDDVMPTIEKMKYEGKGQTATRQAVDVVDEFIESLPEQMKPTEAQKVKRGQQRAAKKAYQKDEDATAAAKTHEAIAKSVRQQLEEIHPELKTLNPQMQEYKLLESAIGDALGRLENRNILSLGTDIGLGVGAGGAAFAGSPEMAGALGAALATKNIMGLPTVKSRLAIALARARNLPNVSTRGAGTRAILSNMQREEYGR